MNTIKSLVLGTLAMAGVWCADAADVTQPLFPYTIVGRVVDAQNKAFDADSKVSLLVRKLDGTIIAKTEVFTPDTTSPYNFRIAVPVASQSTTTHAAPGETLALSAVKDGTVYTGLLKGDDARIGKAGASVSVRVMLSDDSNGNGISDVYEESKFDWLEELGVTDMDPNADYDGDGQSNYAEYLAGTDPFDSDDTFRAKTLDNESAEDGDYFKVSFEANAGRTYAVKETNELKSDATAWRRGTFKTSPEAKVSQERLVTDRSTWELKTIYLLKGKDVQRFYRIELEQ